ncbi:murein biosynthesis integral membrane protein MurJ [Sanguibacter sp. A247]|uniref:murein biosynthesis integral membrane protein MurJ n=1 Tax=unclassified Sanguibacter TaxID=2645534 RepID=UPI003FD77014
MSEAAQGSDSLGRSSVVMAVGTAASRGLGFVRNILLVGAVGATGIAADTFDVANKIPTMIHAVVLGGMLNVVLVPAIVKAYARRDGARTVDKLVTSAALALVALTTIVMVGMGVVVLALGGSQWSPAQQELGVVMALWCAPQLFFYGMYAVLSQVLNARRVFGPGMWAPAMNNVVSILGFGVFVAMYGWYEPGAPLDAVTWWTSPRIILIAGTATLGIVAQALVLLPALRRAGITLRPNIDPRGAGLRSAGKVALWTLAATLLDQGAVAVTTRIAASAPWAAGDGVAAVPGVAGPSAYTQALMIYLLPHSLVTVSVATALFTGMAAAAHAGRKDLVRRDLSRGLRTIGVFTLVATAVLVVLREPLVRVLVPSMSLPSQAAIAQVLGVMALGLAPLGAMVSMKWVYFAFEDGRTVFVIQVPIAATLVGGSLLGSVVLRPELWVVGVAAAMALSNVVGVLLRGRALGRRLDGMDGARIVRLYVRAGVAALVGGGAGFAALSAFGDRAVESWPWAVLACVVVGAVIGAVYLGLLRLMRVEETAALRGLVERVVRRGR